jgi:uncharacterized protein
MPDVSAVLDVEPSVKARPQGARRSGAAFILKCTRQCNLACTYCGDREVAGASMGPEITERLVRESPALFQSVDFIFHGGEPLLMGREFFEDVLALQKAPAVRGCRFRNMVQTNGTLVDEGWCALFRAGAFHLGVSLDGDRAVQDAHRCYHGGRSAYGDVVEGIAALVRNGVERFGILSVVTSALLGENEAQVLAFFGDQLRISKLEPGQSREVSFLALRPNSLPRPGSAEAGLFLDGRLAYGDFLRRVLRAWLDADDPRLRIRELSSKLDVLLGGRSRVCTEAGCCVGRYFGVEPGGALWHCDSFHGDPRFLFGNLLEDPLGELIHSEAFERAAALERELRARCRPCRWFRRCKGGCLYEALAFHEAGLEDRPAHCPSRVAYDAIAQDLARRGLDPGT